LPLNLLITQFWKSGDESLLKLFSFTLLLKRINPDMAPTTATAAMIPTMSNKLKELASGSAVGVGCIVDFGVIFGVAV
jgi:hypothetical protein